MDGSVDFARGNMRKFGKDFYIPSDTMEMFVAGIRKGTCNGQVGERPAGILLSGDVFMEQERFYAGGFLYNRQKNEVFLHLRDSHTDYDPNLWAFFGGMNEGAESPAQCFARELEEEIGLKIALNQAVWLCDYLHVEYDLYRYVFYVESDVSRSQLTLTEGADFDWFPLEGIERRNLADKARQDLRLFRKKLRLYGVP